MPPLDELMKKAKALQAEAHTPSQIADELSLSVETVTWLLTQPKDAEIPKDVHIDWTTVSSHATLLGDTAEMMLKRFLPPGEDGGDYPDVVVGVELSGVPLATLIAAEEGLHLAIYHPAKHSRSESPIGSISATFSGVNGHRCIIIDDVITTGKTVTEAVEYLRRHGATPLAIWVLFDKRGIREVDGVPVHSLFRISRLDG
ncbi:orotate phosphoribosyltransferase-like protein [Methanoculleus sp. FWC-SCC1]|uniref:Transcriptional regulator GfcR n=1 Tax=Methanoculleus frigidifontis TaxID=2584085 RepID=A0ABT8M9T3_9EURY|nr:orotate phosphoribosyltransferase-like protein [Methanoculleus sp. FWC-SCC1]MDN7024699.1 orotate phosphoribosyltransferase-like protein [Methanoculleus sp. FWC-SCC1]